MPMSAPIFTSTVHIEVSGKMPFLGSRDCYSPGRGLSRGEGRAAWICRVHDHDSMAAQLELLNDLSRSAE